MLKEICFFASDKLKISVFSYCRGRGMDLRPAGVLLPAGWIPFILYPTKEVGLGDMLKFFFQYY